MNKTFGCLLSGILVLMLCTCGCSTPGSPGRSPPAGTAPPVVSIPGGEAELEGVMWYLVVFHTASGRSAEPVQGTEITAFFDGKGDISGSSGCNHYRGTYSAKEGEVSIRDIAATEKYCISPSGVMSQEAIYMAFLQWVSGYQTENGLLTLTDNKGSPLLTFGMATPRSLKQ